MKLINSLICITTLLFTTYTQAALITTHEAELDAIFSQASFGNSIIDIRIGMATEIVAAHLLDIGSDAEVAEIFSLHVGPQTAVNFYFIDNLSACGGQINSNFVGCGERPGQDFVVESAFAAGASGAELLAHELGHNLGLTHRVGNFLMDPFINGFTELSAAEVTTIRASSLVQTDGTIFWIDINPVLILARAVPEPGTLLLLLLSSGIFLIQRTSKKIK